MFKTNFSKYLWLFFLENCKTETNNLIQFLVFVYKKFNNNFILFINVLHEAYFIFYKDFLTKLQNIAVTV